MPENNIERGYYGQRLAEEFLAGRGYVIIKRNYRTNLGEIDLIAKDADTVVFIEVKYRRGTGFGSPREAVNKRKQDKIKKTARYYIAENRLAEASFRFDVTEILDINGHPEIEHIENAFW